MEEENDNDENINEILINKNTYYFPIIKTNNKIYYFLFFIKLNSFYFSLINLFLEILQTFSLLISLFFTKRYKEDALYYNLLIYCIYFIIISYIFVPFWQNFSIKDIKKNKKFEIKNKIIWKMNI